MKGKILLAYMMIFILVFASCKANKSSYEIAIDNYVSHYNYESSDETNNSSIQDENKSKTVLGNYIKDPGLCIEDTTEPTSWLLPDTGGIDLCWRATDEKLYETGTLFFEAKAGWWNAITKPIKYDFTDVHTIAIALYVQDQYAFDSCSIRLATTESYGQSNMNNWTKYLEADCGNTAVRLHRGWNYIKLLKKDFHSVGNETWGTIRAIRIIVNIPKYKIKMDYSGLTDEAVSTSIFGIGGIYLNPTYEKPKLMFNFDDSSLSMFQNAFPYMEEKGIKGTLYVCYDHVVENGAGPSYMNEEQHEILYQAGWDIGNHSTTHGDIYSMTEEQIEWEYKTNRDYLVGKGWLSGGILSAPPNGRNNYVTNKVLYNLGYKFVRGNKTHYIDGITPDSIMQFHTFEIKSDIPLETTLKRIDAAIERGSSISIFTHHVVESDPDLFSTTFDYFKAVVDYAVSLRDSGKIDIVTMTEFYNGLIDKNIAQRGY